MSEARFVAKELGSGKQTLVVKHDKLVKENEALIMRLAGLKAIQHSEEGRGLRLAVAHSEAWLDVDADTLSRHKEKLEERLAATRENIARLEVRLNNKNYVEGAPEAVVQQTRDQLTEQQTIEQRLVRELEVTTN